MKHIQTLIQRRRAQAGLWAALALIALPGLAAAQEGFTFGSPLGSFGIRMGYAVPMASSQVFDFVNEQLTLDDSDFRGFAVAFDVGVRVSDRVEVGVEVSHSRSETVSEFRDFVDLDDLPIEQVTLMSRTPFVVNAKFYLSPTGRQVSTLAWVPSKWAPYVGVGGGIVRYEFTQNGDFVDFNTLDIFSDLLTVSEVTGTAHVFAGVDRALTARLVLTGEGRYVWAKGDMGTDFVGFDDLDLSGMQATAGFRVRF